MAVVFAPKGRWEESPPKRRTNEAISFREAVEWGVLDKEGCILIPFEELLKTLARRIA
jgi:hypothetical protein